MALTGQVVATVGHWVRAEIHWVNCNGQVVSVGVPGHWVRTATQAVVVAGQVVLATGQAVNANGKIVGRTAASVLTIRSSRVVGVGSPGIWINTRCWPLL